MISKKVLEVKFNRLLRRTESCWEWIGKIDEKGYGRIYYRNYQSKAHRLSYLIYRGEIPKDMDVHHKCKNRGCVNPDHLELQPHSDHEGSVSSIYRRRNFCKNGHEFTPENIAHAPSHGNARICKQCRKIRNDSRKRT